MNRSVEENYATRPQVSVYSFLSTSGWWADEIGPNHRTDASGRRDQRGRMDQSDLMKGSCFALDTFEPWITGSSPRRGDCGDVKALPGRPLCVAGDTRGIRRSWTKPRTRTTGQWREKTPGRWPTRKLETTGLWRKQSSKWSIFRFHVDLAG